MDYRDLVDSDNITYRLSIYMLRFLLILFSIFAPFALKSQVKGDIGIMSGVSYYLGDVNPAQQYYNPKMLYSGFYRYNFHKRYSIKGSLSYTTLSGSVSDFENFLSDSEEEIANYSFNTPLIDFSIVFEYNFWPYLTTLKEKENMSPYIFAGLNSFYTMGDITSLYYGVPFGAGFKYNLTKRIGIGLEYSFRKTFTDQIDGSKLWSDGENFAYTKDWYSFTGFFITYKFYSKKALCPAYN